MKKMHLRSAADKIQKVGFSSMENRRASTGKVGNSVERERFSTKNLPKFSSHLSERGRNSQALADPDIDADFLEENTVKCAKQRAKQAIGNSAASERGRRDIQSVASNSDPTNLSAKSKDLPGVNGLARVRKNQMSLKKSSNKHAVDSVHSVHDTNTKSSLRINKRNTNLPEPSSNSESDSWKETKFKKKVVQHAPTTEVNSVLPCPENLPFLTKKSSRNPIINPAFCDRLSVTFDPPTTDLDGMASNARMLSTCTDEHYTLQPLPKIGRQLYNFNYRLVDFTGGHVALLQFDPRNSRSNFARIECNPREIGPDGISELKRVLKGLFGTSYRDYLADGNITRLDAAADIRKSRPHDFMFYTDRARSSSVWQRNFNLDGTEEWETETLCLGSPTSDYFVQVYDKAAQLWKIKGKVIDSLLTRIEVRFTPRGKNGRSLQAGDILSVKNPFESIHVAYYPAPEGGDPWFKFFICAARQLGAEEAIRMIKDRAERSRYWTLLLEYEADWWQPDILWQDFLRNFRALDLFPANVFDSK